MKHVLTMILCVCAALSAVAQEQRSDAEFYKEHYTGKNLYTTPDPSAGGGIRAEVVRPQQPLVAVLALPPNEPTKVYKGEIMNGGTSFEFRGLPVAKYDLFVVYEQDVYEGLTLHRGESTLTRDDQKSIEAIITKSEPFFDRKYVHRTAGETGHMTGSARCIATFLRTKPMYDYSMTHRYTDDRRNFKLVLLEQTGPGWQILRTREIFSAFVPPGKGESRFHYREALHRIRVVDSVKDLGELNLVMAERSQ